MQQGSYICVLVRQFSALGVGYQLRQGVHNNGRYYPRGGGDQESSAREYWIYSLGPGNVEMFWREAAMA